MKHFLQTTSAPSASKTQLTPTNTLAPKPTLPDGERLPMVREKKKLNLKYHRDIQQLFLNKGPGGISPTLQKSIVTVISNDECKNVWLFPQKFQTSFNYLRNFWNIFFFFLSCFLGLRHHHQTRNGKIYTKYTQNRVKQYCNNVFMV